MAAVLRPAPLRISSPSNLLQQISSSIVRSTPLLSVANTWWQPKLPTLAAALPAVSLNIPGWLEGLWEGILKAVPKKRPSYSKTRSKQLAGKALKDVTALCHCPSCGRTKRMHVACPYCVKKIMHMWREEDKKAGKQSGEP